MTDARRTRGIPDYIDTLDGFRAIAAFLVMMFHLWQQSWVSMVVHLGPVTIDFTPPISMGGLGVELLFVLSGFCLYYPFARHPERKLRPGTYFYKRAVRILPTYFLSVLICSAYQIGRLDPALLKEQFIGNMTLTQMSTASLAYNHLNPVLWSIAIEVQFYILFPLLKPLFDRKPLWVMAGAFLIGEGWRMYLRDVDSSRIGFLMNQLPGMIDVFVAGMLSAHVTALLQRRLRARQQKALAPYFALGALMFAMLYFAAVIFISDLRYRNIPDNLSILQMHTRKYITAAYAGCICCSVLSSRWMHVLLGNPLMRFGSMISYQLYLWHGWFALRLKEWRIPDYVTQRPMDDPAWRFPYLMITIGISLAVAILMTFLVERPASKLLMEHAPRWARPKEEPAAPEEVKTDGAQ